MGNKIIISGEEWWDDSYTCPKCGKVWKSTNEWLASECWLLDHDPIE